MKGLFSGNFTIFVKTYPYGTVRMIHHIQPVFEKLLFEGFSLQLFQ